MTSVESRSEWNRLILGCPDFSCYSSFEWGEYKRDKWRVQRLAFHRRDRVVGGVQLLTKRRLGMTIGWAPGGVALDSSESVDGVLSGLRQSLGAGPFALRFTFVSEATPENELAVGRVAGLVRASKSTRTGHTFLLDLEDDRDFVERMTSHHRRAYRKSIKNGLEFESTGVLAGEFARLSGAMASLKGSARIGLSLADIERVTRAFGESLAMYSVKHEGERVAACLIMRFGPYAYYYAAASNERGRELRASHFLIKTLCEQLRGDGVRSFDFGGVSMIKGYGEGVSRFKMGFPGRLVSLVGDYDFSNNRLMSFVLNSAVGGRFPR